MDDDVDSLVGRGGNLESHKKPTKRGERDCGGSLAGTESRSMLPPCAFSTIACKSSPLVASTEEKGEVLS